MIPRLNLGVILLFLMLGFGCSTAPKVVTVPQIVLIAPDESLLMETPVPKRKGNRNADLIEHNIRLLEALAECNATKREILSFIQKAKKEYNKQ